MNIPERAYVSATLILASPPKIGDKAHFVVTILNSGSTTAVDVVSDSRFVLVPKGTPETLARTQAFGLTLPEKASKTLLAAGQTAQQILDSNAELPESVISELSEGSIVGYAFIRIRYKDVFDHQHHTDTCEFYFPDKKQMANCSVLNNAD